MHPHAFICKTSVEECSFLHPESSRRFCAVFLFYFFSHLIFLSLPHQGEPGTPGEKVLCRHCSVLFVIFVLWCFSPLLRELRNSPALPSAQTQVTMTPAPMSKGNSKGQSCAVMPSERETTANRFLPSCWCLWLGEHPPAGPTPQNTHSTLVSASSFSPDPSVPTETFGSALRCLCLCPASLSQCGATCFEFLRRAGYKNTPSLSITKQPAGFLSSWLPSCEAGGVVLQPPNSPSLSLFFPTKGQPGVPGRMGPPGLPGKRGQRVGHRVFGLGVLCSLRAGLAGACLALRCACGASCVLLWLLPCW